MSSISMDRINAPIEDAAFSKEKEKAKDKYKRPEDKLTFLKIISIFEKDDEPRLHFYKAINTGDVKWHTDFDFDLKWLRSIENGETLRNQIEKDPYHIIEIMQDALNLLATTLCDNNPDIIVRIKSPANPINVNDLDAKKMDKLVVVEGIMRSKTELLGKVVEATWVCKTCSDKQKRTLSKTINPSTSPYHCYKCNKNVPEIKFFLAGTKDTSLFHFKLEDNSGSLSTKRHIKVTAAYDLASSESYGQMDIGSRIKVTGVLRKQKLKKGEVGEYQYYIDCLSIERLDDKYKEIKVTEDNDKEIRELLKDKDAVIYFSEIIFSPIHGYEKVKQTLVCQMVGIDKIKKKLKTARGNLHILLLGDPASGKSTLLEIMTKVALKSAYASGKSSSVAGITANVTKDETIGSWVVEGGLFPMMHNGILCLDEFDKISNEDKSALHEGMSQGTITVNKANVHATLVAETSLLASANPEKGRFDQNKEVYEQFNLLPTLVNRFDVIFLFRDKPTEALDDKVADKVIDSFLEDIDTTKEDLIETFKKYLIIAKRTKTTFDREAVDDIKKTYMKLRIKSIQETSNKGIKSMQISPRQLEAAIRLALAHARANLKSKVEKDDVQWAINTLMFSLGEISTDLITGTIDIDVIETGVSTGKRNLSEAIVSLIRSYPNHQANEDDVINAFKGQVDEMQIEKVIKQLEHHGDVFRPTGNIIKLL